MFSVQLFHQLSSRASFSLSSSWLTPHGGHRGKQIGRPPAVIKIDIGTTLGPRLSPPKANRIPRPPMPSARIGTVLQASKQHTACPPTVVQTKSHLDSREIYGKTMLRKIAPTAWSSKYGLAGQNMEQVKLVDLIWRGWDNQHLRALSHGSYMSMIVCRTVNEAVFLQAVLSLVREKEVGPRRSCQPFL